KTHRITWAVCVLLAAVVLVGIGVLGVRLRPYWVARYRGGGANLRRAVLRHAPLQRAFLEYANLRDADLRASDLTGALLGRADLPGADFRGPSLKGVVLVPLVWDGPDQLGWGARYDARTRWPAGFDPRAHGAVLIR